MASIDPEIPLSPTKKLKLSHLNTSEQIKLVRDEIKSNMKLLRDQLDAKECELLEEVDRLGALQVSEKRELELELDELIERRKAFQNAKVSIIEIQGAFRLAISDFGQKINSVQLKLKQIHEIKSSWKLEQCTSSINSLCSLSNVTNVESLYLSKSISKWDASIGGHSSQICHPVSLAIQQSSNNVFVSDRNGNRIQVFNFWGKHIRKFENFRGPLKVFHVDNTSIYAVTSNNPEEVSIVVLSLDTLVDRPIHCPSTFSMVSSDIITVHPSRTGLVFYSCAAENSNFSHFRKYLGTETLFMIKFTENSSSSHPTFSANSHTEIQYKELSMGKPVGITTDGMHIYILVTDFEHLILEYNSDCEFVRSFCPSSLLSGARSVCVDSRGNILVAGSEGDSTKLLCLSPDGDVIHEFLVPCQSCVSIAVNSKFDISLLCDDTKHGLTTY